MERCKVDGCGGAAWTRWMGYDLCKACSEAASAWNTTSVTASEALTVLERIASNLREYGTRYEPEEHRR